MSKKCSRRTTERSGAGLSLRSLSAEGGSASADDGTRRKQPMSASHLVRQQLVCNRSWKAASLLVPGLLICSIASAAPQPRRQEQHFKVQAHPVITLHNPNGTITVKAWTKAEVMVISNRASDGVEADAAQMGNRVDVSTHAGADTLA